MRLYVLAVLIILISLTGCNSKHEGAKVVPLTDSNVASQFIQSDSGEVGLPRLGAPVVSTEKKLISHIWLDLPDQDCSCTTRSGDGQWLHICNSNSKCDPVEPDGDKPCGCEVLKGILPNKICNMNSKCDSYNEQHLGPPIVPPKYKYPFNPNAAAHVNWKTTCYFFYSETTYEARVTDEQNGATIPVDSMQLTWSEAAGYGNQVCADTGYCAKTNKGYNVGCPSMQCARVVVTMGHMTWGASTTDGACPMQ